MSKPNVVADLRVWLLPPLLQLVLVSAVFTLVIPEHVVADSTTSASSSTSGTNVKPGGLYQTAEFVTPHPGANFRLLVVNEQNQNVYLGGMNYIYSLNKDLVSEKEVNTGPRDDNTKCPPPVNEFQQCPHKQVPTNNYIKVLVVDYVHQRLISCGTLIHGYCERRHLPDISVRDPPYYDNSVVTNNRTASTVAFIAQGPAFNATEPQPNVLYVSVTWSEQVLDVPSFSSRNLTDFSLALKHSSRFTSTSFNFEHQQRQQFLVTYIYGFGSEGFSYMLTVQKTSSSNENFQYHSVMIRVCQQDKNFYSYVEVPLNCSRAGVQYDLLQAAYLDKPGRSLALSLGINTQTDVLYGVFATAVHPGSDSPTSHTALCVFPMNYVGSKFTENIKRCFDGEGISGGGHLGSSKPCSKNNEIVKYDQYCGETDSNQPLGGTISIDSEAVLTFPDTGQLLTAIRVAVTHDYTVAFVGTDHGNILKVSVESNASANVYETVSAIPGQAIKKDMNFDEDKKHLYVLTEKKVIKMKVQDCSQYTSCSDCVGARDPYCGWCSTDHRCSLRSQCQGMDIPKGWLPFNNMECPKIKRIIPKQIQKDKKRLLTLDIQNLPDLPKPSLYQCVFTLASNLSAKPLVTPGNRTTNNIQCYTPVVDKLPLFQDGKDSVAMKLSVHMNGQELVHDTITIFDCTVHTSCIACSISQFSCTWCIKSHQCTDNADRHCHQDNHVTGINASHANGSTSSSTSQGPTFCPRFEGLGQNPQILVAAGPQPVEIKVRGQSLQDFQLNDLRCQFNLDQIVEVPATPRLVQGRVFDITCQGVKFDYIRAVKTLEVPFKIIWGGAPNALDNTKGVLVVMYKCSYMASTCGACFTVEPQYQCGWCNNTDCRAQSLCQGQTFQQTGAGAVCQNPRIFRFSPQSGPVQGGTLVTIEGQNLGSAKNEVRVQIDMVVCRIISFRAPNRMVCRTEPAAVIDVSSHVRVIIGNVAGQQVMAESVEEFSFVQPRVTDISPIMGPYDGGTRVTFIGEHMDAGSDISIVIGQKYPCEQIRRINMSALSCETSEAGAPSAHSLDVVMRIDNAELQTTGVVFKYVQNPNVTWISRYQVVKSGGVQINVSGENLHNVQSPQILIWYQGQAYSGPCKFTTYPATNITCISPSISNFNLTSNSFEELDFGFRMDNVSHLQRLTRLGKMKVYPDPLLEPFRDGEKIHQQGTELLFINGRHLEPLKQSDVKVYIGKVECVVTSVVNTVIMCKPPSSPPSASMGNGFPEVTVRIGQNLTYSPGILRYEQQEELSKEAIIGIVAAVGVFTVFMIVICIACIIKFRRNDDMMKKMRKDMDQLESRVANECKEAFAELQTDMSELASDLSGSGSIPFWDYRTYCMRVLFPGDIDHPVIRDLELDYHHREDIEKGLKLFSQLIRNRTFLLIFIRTLESNQAFYMKERVTVASLISVALQTQMEYVTEILKTLLAELIEKTVENPKVHPKLLLRRNESIAEKMLTNWFTFLLYKFLKECAGEPLFMLYGAIKQQVSKGPVDAVTSEARYSLSEDKLIRQQINFKHMVLHVMDLDKHRCPQVTHPVKVLDCDTISQVKEKILDAMYKSASFGSRPPKEELDLVLFDHPPPEWISSDKSQVPLKQFHNKDSKHLVLNDEDHTTKSEGDCKRLNSLSHYKVPDGACVALHPKQTSIYNMSVMSEKSKYSDNSYNRSPSLNRSVSPQNVHIDVENCNFYHLVRHQDSESTNKEGERVSKMVSEIYLPRLLVTKGTLQTFVDDLFERIFSTTHRGSALPLAIKYMFDFLDDQALHHNMGDEVVHTWKSNSLPLRFWVNVIKNPNFAFDIYKSNIVDACLTVIGQTFMDCCSTNEHKLTKDSPSGKLLYAKDIPKYKSWVSRYYQDIKIMPAISDQDMTAMLAEESRTHEGEFNTNAALLELYKYVRTYYDEIVNALEDDEFAKKSKLTYKLDQVSAAMEGTTVC